MADEIKTDGAAVQQAIGEALKAQNKKKKKKRLIIIGVIAVLLVIIIIAGSGSGDNENGESKQNGAEPVAAETKSNASADGKIGDYVCTVKSAEICTNWEDKDSVKITYVFTNNSKEAQSFDIALIADLYQDGIGLETTFTGADDEDDLICDVKIQPGATKEVYKVYKLRDTVSPIDVEISEFISLSNDKLHYNVTLE